MKETQPFDLGDGTIVYIEVEDARGGMQRVGRGGQSEEKAATRFTDAIANIRPAAEAVINAFREMNTPDEIALEFGMKFSGQLGTAMIASASTEAAFKVSLKWSRTPKADENGPE